MSGAVCLLLLMGFLAAARAEDTHYFTGRKLASGEPELPSTAIGEEPSFIVRPTGSLVELPDPDPQEGKQRHLLELNSTVTEVNATIAGCTDNHWGCYVWADAKVCGPEYIHQGKPIGTYWCPVACGTCNMTAIAAEPATAALAAEDTFAGQLLAHVNWARTQAGLQPVCHHAKLTAASAAHSKDQAAMRQMSHYGSNGGDVATRIIAAGYDGWTAAGENVAWNQQSVKEVHDAWMASPPHRANVLSAEWLHMGAEVVWSDNGPYYTQVFGVSSLEACS